MDFFKELDQDISNIGTNKVWKKNVGGKIIWFSPIPYTAQLSLNDTLANEDLGNHAIQETKRLTLSHSIVGFGSHDLREYKDQFIFEIPNEKKLGEKIKVNLQKYVYHKIAKWDSDFTDVAFSILADCLESNKKETLKDVLFENLKEPIEELAEFEIKVAELRDRLGMSQLVEKGSEKASQEVVPEPQEEALASEGSEVPFDPFEAVEDPQETAKNISVDLPISIPESDLNTFEPVDRPTLVEKPVKSIPVPQLPEMSPIQKELQRRSSKIGNTPETAYIAQPSVNALIEQDKIQGVIEKPKGNQPPVMPPRIDQPLGNRNPRFSYRK